MGKSSSDILTDVADYYSARLAQHGATPRGVDWNGGESQILRFEQLTKIIFRPENFSLNDLGCGYGALLDYMKNKYRDFFYTGCDISGEMIISAQKKCTSESHIKFVKASAPPEKADYGIASGIFNVRLGHDNAEWWKYLQSMLDVLDQTSRCGFAFNCLTSYSDTKRMRDDLYYANPCVLFDFCKKQYSRHVALLHDYGLYEFTILVRKEI
jgi:SAM-dependent methyltransferase